nr:hypothetical protein [Sulfurimonas sp. SAG-AH-194-L11]
MPLEEQKVLIMKELQSYKEKKSSFKPLAQSMKEISAWLSKKEK